MHRTHCIGYYERVIKEVKASNEAVRREIERVRAETVALARVGSFELFVRSLALPPGQSKSILDSVFNNRP